MTDGRTARRERGKQAVLEAILERVAETGGRGASTPEEIAARAGVSVASLFRYFGTLEGMREAATQRWFDMNGGLLEIPNVGNGSLTERIDTFVGSRLSTFEAAKPASRLLRRLAVENDDARERLLWARTTRIDQIRRHFDPELSHLPAEQVDCMVAVIATLSSHESFVQLTEQDGMDLTAAAVPIRSALLCLLSNASERDR